MSIYGPSSPPPPSSLVCFCKCLQRVCLPACSRLAGVLSGQAVVSGLPVHRFRLRCGVPPSCVCQRQFGLIYRPLTHSAADPTSAAGMAIPCVGGGSTWVVLHWWGSDVVLLRSCRSSGERRPADGERRKCCQKTCLQPQDGFTSVKATGSQLHSPWRVMRRFRTNKNFSRFLLTSGRSSPVLHVVVGSCSSSYNSASGDFFTSSQRSLPGSTHTVSIGCHL